MNKKPVIGITMGCPVSIGPEIILKCFKEIHKLPDVTPVILGDLPLLKRCTATFGIDMNVQPWIPGDKISENTIPVYEISSLSADDLQWGSPNNTTGKAMAHYITTGVKLIQSTILDGITTCPIAKSTLNAAGYNYPGHTEMLADLTRSSSYGMMMAGSKLRVTLVSIHCPFTQIVSQLSVDSILATIRITQSTLLNDFGIKHPKIAIAGLNPHAGENGIFGKEEETVLSPAITQAQNENINAIGPFPADTVFYKAVNGEFDAVVCMYHDQGLTPFKLIHFADGVNVTMGLPIVRTSVDHGTAYDIAGKGIADHTSLLEAINLATTIVKNRTH